MQLMKAVNIKAPGSSDQLEIIEEKIPTPKRDQVLIKIKAGFFGKCLSNLQMITNSSALKQKIL